MLTGTITPRTGPPHKVTRGKDQGRRNYTAGAKEQISIDQCPRRMHTRKQYGQVRGRKVMVHHDPTSKTTNFEASYGGCQRFGSVFMSSEALLRGLFQRDLLEIVTRKIQTSCNKIDAVPKKRCDQDKCSASQRE